MEKDKNPDVRCVERHLYKVVDLLANGQYSVYYIARFKAWYGKQFKKWLSRDLPTARKVLREYEKLNDLRQPLILEEEVKELEAKKLQEEKANAMTVGRWIPICLKLKEMQEKDSTDRDEQLSTHIVRLMGGVPLAEISRQDLFNYRDTRRKETLFRCGEWTKIPVKDGTIRNELALARRTRNLALVYQEEMRKKGIPYEVSGVSFDGVLPPANHRQRVLKDSERQRLLKESPVWLRWLLIAGLETCLSEGDLLRLRLEDIDEENGVIVPDGGRLKTAVRQAAPLTEAVRTVLAEIKRERQRAKVRNLDTASLVFVRQDGSAITRNAVHKAMRKACKRADVRDFHFHDCRHTAKTSWARRGIPVEAAMLGAGHKSVQMHQAYVHLQQTDIGRIFGTSAKIASIGSKKSQK